MGEIALVLNLTGMDPTAPLTVAGRVTPLEATMETLPFADGQFDLLWSEGASKRLRCLRLTRPFWVMRCTWRNGSIEETCAFPPTGLKVPASQFTGATQRNPMYTA